MGISQIHACIFCAHANPQREKDGKIRCERYSVWKNPIETVKCDEFIDKGVSQMLKYEHDAG